MPCLAVPSANYRLQVSNPDFDMDIQYQVLTTDL